MADMPGSVTKGPTTQGAESNACLAAHEKPGLRHFVTADYYVEQVINYNIKFEIQKRKVVTGK
jgi:hypothetical protein